MAENIVSSESGEKYAQIKHSLQALTVQISAKQIYWWILGVQQGMDFFTKGSIKVYRPEITVYS